MLYLKSCCAKISLLPSLAISRVLALDRVTTVMLTVLLAGKKAVPEDLPCKDLPPSKPGNLWRFGDVTTVLLTVAAGEEAVPEVLQCNHQRFGVRYGNVTTVLLTVLAGEEAVSEPAVQGSPFFQAWQSLDI